MDKLISALVEAQKKISNANRTAMNDFFKSQKNRSGSPYATLEDVIQAVKEPLLEQGILYQQHSELVEGGVCIETIFYGHGHKLETGKYFVPADKNTPHGYGSALTYARRYSLSSACGIGAADDDGNSGTIETAKAEKVKPIKKPKPDSNAKYKVMNAEKKTVLASAETEDKLLEIFRQLLKKPEEESSKNLYLANKDMIIEAGVNAEGETKEGLSKLQEVFEKEVEDNVEFE